MESSRLYSFWLSDKNNVVMTMDLLDSFNGNADSAQIELCLNNMPTELHNDPRVLAKIIELHIRLVDYQSALPLTEKLLALTENHAMAVHYAILVHFLVGNNQVVINYSQQYDLMAESIIFVVRSLYLLGDIQPAIDKLISIAPTDAESFGVLAIMHLDLGLLDKATQYCQQALAIIPQQFEALLTLASTAAMHHDFEQADQPIEHLLVQQPQNGRVLSLKGQSQLYQTDFPGAITTLLLATEYMPEHIGTWHLLAWAYFLSDNLVASEDAFNQSLALDRNFAESHGGLACVYANQKRTVEAEKSSKLAIKLDKFSFSGRFAQAILLANSGNESQATQLVEKITGGSTTHTNTPYADLINKALAKRK